MSKILYICNRNTDFDEKTKIKLFEICNQLTPDNVKTRSQHRVVFNKKIAYAVTMQNTALHESGLNLLLGVLYGEQSMNWTKPKTNYPDGNYCLFRKDQHLIEVISDASASRTIWYYHDKEFFAASTSQRAIILFLGTFCFDKRTIPWMLSTGSLGPQYSWDKRLNRLQADSALLLDKNTWKLSINQPPIVLLEKKSNKKDHKKRLREAIRQTFKSLQYVDFQRWILPLSGGYDSRAILCFLKEQVGVPKDLRTVTWGLKASVNEEENDAKIANDVAQNLGVQHDYYHTDISSEPIEDVLNRFIFCSEGRIDHIAGYMDGMEIWRIFHDEDKITGIIRGDEGFGWTQVSSELTVRLNVGCALCSDFGNLKNAIRDFNLQIQEIPPEFEKKSNESFSAWRDRLYHSYRLPTILAALSDIKFSYVEQINPFLSKAILTAVRALPDDLRTDKALFKEIVNAVGPNIPYASKGATANPKGILKNETVISIMKNEFESSYADDLFGHELVQYVLNGIIKSNKGKKSNKKVIKKIISSFLPQRVKNMLQDKVIVPRVDNNVLAFRMFIILKMHKILERDAAKFSI